MIYTCMMQYHLMFFVNSCGRDRTRNTGMIVCQVCSENFQTNINCELGGLRRQALFPLNVPLSSTFLQISQSQWMSTVTGSMHVKQQIHDCYTIMTMNTHSSHTFHLLILPHIHFTITTTTCMCICRFWDMSMIFQTRTSTIIRNQSVLWSITCF